MYYFSHCDLHSSQSIPHWNPSSRTFWPYSFVQLAQCNSLMSRSEMTEPSSEIRIYTEMSHIESTVKILSIWKIQLVSNWSIEERHTSTHTRLFVYKYNLSTYNDVGDFVQCDDGLHGGCHFCALYSSGIKQEYIICYRGIQVQRNCVDLGCVEEWIWI